MKKLPPEIVIALISAFISPTIAAVLTGFGFLLIDYQQHPGNSFVEFYYPKLRAHPEYIISFLILFALIGVGLWFLLRAAFTRRTPIVSEIQGPLSTESPGNGDVFSRSHRPLMNIDPIKYPDGREQFPPGDLTVTGTYPEKAPPGWRFALFTRRENTYWPKGRFVDNHDGTWSCVLTEPNKGVTQVVATQVTDGVYLWINLYSYVGKEYKEWVGQKLDQLPESIRVDDIATIKIGP